MYNVKVVNIAHEIILDMGGENYILTIPKVAFWLRGKVGDLNSFINGDWYVDQDDEIVTSSHNHPHPDPSAIWHDYAPFTQPPSSGISWNPTKKYIGIDEKAILKKMYNVYYYDTKARKTLDSLDENLVLSINEDGQEITLVNRNEIAKTFLSLKNSSIEELKKLIFGYIRNRNVPGAVFGDDPVSAWAYGDVNYSHTAQERFYTF